MTVPFLWSRHAQPRTRWRGSPWWHAWRAPHNKQKLKVRAFKEACQEAFSKDSEVVRVAQQAYWKTHKVIFKQEESYDLTSVFLQMSWDMNLLNSKMHEVQEIWTSCRRLRAASHAMQTSPKDIQFFCMVSPKKSPNIMGLKGVHSPEALHWQGSYSFCPWCRKEGQNESIVMNRLRTMHYHLGLVCAPCGDYFLTSADAMLTTEMRMMSTYLRKPKQPPEFCGFHIHL